MLLHVTSFSTQAKPFLRIGGEKELKLLNPSEKIENTVAEKNLDQNHATERHQKF